MTADPTKFNFDTVFAVPTKVPSSNIVIPFTNVAGQPTFYWGMGVAGFYGETLNGDWQVTVSDYSDDALSPGAWEGFELEVYYR